MVVMECPRCDHPTRVLESRRANSGGAVRRRRACSACGYRFTTFERRDPESLYVRKRDGARQRFQRGKLRAALLRATHKRQVSADDVEALVDRVEAAIEAAGGELSAQRIGGECLAGLEALDRGAYLQFLGTLPAAGGEAPATGGEATAASVEQPANAGAPEPNAEIARSDASGSVRAARKSSSLPAETGS